MSLACRANRAAATAGHVSELGGFFLNSAILLPAVFSEKHDLGGFDAEYGLSANEGAARYVLRSEWEHVFLV